MRSDKTRFLIFFAVATTIVGAAYAYAGGQILHVVPAGPLRAALGTMFFLAFAALPLTFLARLFYENLPGFEFFSWIAYIGFGLVSLFLTFFLLRDIVLGLARLSASLWAVPLLDEHATWAVNVSVVALATGLGALGFFNARRVPVIKHVPIKIADLHADLEGFRIVQISDVHIGPTIRRPFIESLVQEINALDADMIAVTGDLVDGTVEELGSHAAPLAGLRSKHGTFFVTGNHEYYSGAVSWVKMLREIGFHVLLNEHACVMRGGAVLVVGGVTDITAHAHVPSHASDPHAALRGAPRADYKLLLAHQPRSVFEAAEAGFDLVLSGHTHGGQYFPGTIIVKWVQPFVAGLHRFRNSLIYVSRGTGYWGPPIRIGAPSEITVLTLLRA